MTCFVRENTTNWEDHCEEWTKKYVIRYFKAITYYYSILKMNISSF